MIKIEDKVKDTVTNAGGYQLYCLIKPHIGYEDKILISLENLSPMSSSFMHSSFGELIEEYGLKKVKSTLRFTNYKMNQIDSIKSYFDSFSELQH